MLKNRTIKLKCTTITLKKKSCNYIKADVTWQKKERMHNAISSTASVATLLEKQPLFAFEYQSGGNFKIFPKQMIKKKTCKPRSAPGST